MHKKNKIVPYLLCVFRFITTKNVGAELAKIVLAYVLLTLSTI